MSRYVVTIEQKWKLEMDIKYVQDAPSGAECDGRNEIAPPRQLDR